MPSIETNFDGETPMGGQSMGMGMSPGAGSMSPNRPSSPMSPKQFIAAVMQESSELTSMEPLRPTYPELPEETFGMRGVTKYFYGALDDSSSNNEKSFVTIRRRIGQARLIQNQVHFRRDQGIAPFTIPAPCAHVYNQLPLKFRPDFFKLYGRMKNPLESSQALNEEWLEDKGFGSFSSEVMVAILLTKSPPSCSTNHLGHPIPGPKPLITLPPRQLQPNMKRLSIQLDSQSYYSCCKVDKICPELELKNWVEIIKTFSVEHGRFSNMLGGQQKNVRRISFEGPDLDAAGPEERRKMDGKDHREAMRRDLKKARANKAFKVRTKFNAEQPKLSMHISETVSRLSGHSKKRGTEGFDMGNAIGALLEGLDPSNPSSKDNRANEEPLDPRWMACSCLVHPGIEIMDCTDVFLKRDSLNIVSLLRRLTTLILDFNDLLEDEDLICLKSIENLEKLEISYCPKLRSLENLEFCPRLKEVVCKYCESLGVPETNTKVRARRGSEIMEAQSLASLAIPGHLQKPQTPESPTRPNSRGKSQPGSEKSVKSNKSGKDKCGKEGDRLSLFVQGEGAEKRVFLPNFLDEEEDEEGCGQRGSILSSLRKKDAGPTDGRWWDYSGRGEKDRINKLVTDYLNGPLEEEDGSGPMAIGKAGAAGRPQSPPESPNKKQVKVTIETSQTDALNSSKPDTLSRAASGKKNLVLAESIDLASKSLPTKYNNADTSKDIVLLRSKTIKVLNLEGCTNVRNAKLFSVLEELDLSHLPSLNHICNCSIQQLRVLDLQACQALEQVNYKNLFEAAPYIRNLNLSRCANLKSLNVQQAGCLELLFLGDCKNLCTLGENVFPISVKYVDCHGCDNLTDIELLKVCNVPSVEQESPSGGFLGMSGLGASGKKMSITGQTPSGAGGTASQTSGGSMSMRAAAPLKDEREFESIVGDVDVFLLDDVEHYRRGTCAKVIDVWMEKKSEVKGMQWRYYLEPIPGQTCFSLDAASPSDMMHSQRQLSRGGMLKPFVVWAEDQGTKFDIVPIEDKNKGIGNPFKRGTVVSSGLDMTSADRRSVGSVNKSVIMSPTTPNAGMWNSMLPGGQGIQTPAAATAQKRMSINSSLMRAGTMSSAMGMSMGLQRARSQSIGGGGLQNLVPGPLVVWPTTERANSLLPRWFIKEAARGKYLKACEVARKLYAIHEKSQFGGGRNDDDAVRRHLDDVTSDLQAAIARAEEADINEFVLMRFILPYAQQWLGNNVQLRDFLGSENKFTPKEMEKNELESELRRDLWFDFLPNTNGLVFTQFGETKPVDPMVMPLMKGVRFSDREKFKELTLEMQAALNTFDMLRLKTAITRTCGPTNPRFVLKEDKSEGAVLPHALVKLCEAYYRKIDGKIQFWNTELATGIYEDLNVRTESNEKNEPPGSPKTPKKAGSSKSPQKFDPAAITYYKDVISFDTDCSISIKFSAVPFQVREFPAKPTAILLKKDVVLKMIKFVKKTFLEQTYLPYALEYCLYMPPNPPKGVAEPQWKSWHKQVAGYRARLLHKQLYNSGGDLGAEEMWKKQLEPEPRLVTKEDEQGVFFRRIWPKEFYPPPKRTDDEAASA